MKKKLILTDAEREVFAKVGATGGAARAKNMSAAARKKSAQKAAAARWNKKN